MSTGLVLRDVHVTPAPSWWPPAPGWWWLAAIVLLLISGWAWWWWRGQRRRRSSRQLFDTACIGAPAAQVAAISELLRRAARRVDPAAVRLEGEAWLRWLDGDGTAFSAGPGRLLLVGGYQREVDGDALQRLKAVAGPRFLQLMERRRR